MKAQLLDYLEMLKAYVDHGQADPVSAKHLMEYWQRHIESDQQMVKLDFFYHAILQEQIQHSSILLYLYNVDQQRVDFEFGIERELSGSINEFILKNQEEILKSNGMGHFSHNLEGYRRVISLKPIFIRRNRHSAKHFRSSRAQFVLVRAFYIQPESGHDDHLAKLFQNYFIYNKVKPIENHFQLFSIFDERLKRMINRTLHYGKHGAVVVFKFQKFDDYFRVVGDHMAGEILEEITTIIEGVTQKNERLFQITPRMIIVYSQGGLEPDLVKRFRKLFFHVKGLILEFRIKVVEIHKLADIEEAYKIMFEDDNQPRSR